MSDAVRVDVARAEDVRDAERQAQIERNQPRIDLLQSWLDDDEKPTDEEERLWQEMIRDLDSYRPDRPLFEKHYSCANS